MTSKFKIYTSLIILVLSIISLKVISQETKYIEILHSDKLLFAKKVDPDLRKLIGNVELLHDSSFLYCDSAYFYKIKNSFRAFGNVLLARGDTLFMYGDSLHYDGNTSIAQVYSNVRLKDNTMSLRTNYLNFNMNENKSYYNGGGELIDSVNTLTSKRGIYLSDIHKVYFKDDVTLHNPDYSVFSDTLAYSTESEISYFFGPTEIVSDSLYIYCIDGWYDTIKEISQYGKNTVIINGENTIEADSIHYNRLTGVGIAMKNITITDTIQKIILKGNNAFFDQSEGYSYITDSALFIQHDGKDSLYMHADTLFSSKDSSKQGRLIRAWNHVKFFRYELQGKCDSLAYTTTDSLIKLYHSPILWNEQSQLTANYIQIHTDGQKADKIEMNQSAFMISKEDSSKYNQIYGKDMIGYIRDNDIYRIDVFGNAQTVYFPKDGDEFKGANKSASSDLVLFMKDGKVNKLKMIGLPEPVMNPLNMVKDEDIFLKGFLWLEEFRPLKKEDIFNW